MNTKMKNKLFIMPNEDKIWHEQASDNLCSFPHPFRICFIAPPNAGKSLILKNILIQTQPPFEAIYLVHNDKDSAEYNNIDLTYFDDKIPSIDEFDSTKKNLLIIEDIDFKNMKKTDKSILDRHMGCNSTHKNISIMLTAQDGFNVPPSIRRMCSVLCLWKGHDLTALAIMSSRFGIKAKDLKYFFEKVATGKHDFIVIDTHREGKLRIRKNLIEPVDYIL